ncbi:hypothetical protein K1T71_008573 [Dendrolimus kikuchii]|uniref:Uncharacterized protein n=1 Tax=Dendrolimus kikuchii TaxID=765133 RepID=A0ACC1CUS7_9NEOP|nr:hypothetical protein K1T71_008573 [Dendrolimus kikuchii]
MCNVTENENAANIKLWSEMVENLLSQQSSTFLIAYIVSMYTIFIFSLIGNLLTCIVIYWDRSMRTTTNYYLLNLAVSDFFVSFGILLEIKEKFDHLDQYLHYHFGSFACKIHYFLIMTLWNNNILILTVLAIERYLAICHPLCQSSKTGSRVMKVIGLVWVVAILESLPEVWTVDVLRSPRASLCFTTPTRFAKIVNGVVALFTFVIPLGIMTFVYTMIAFAVNNAQNKDMEMNRFNHSDNRGKVNKLIVALTVSFLVCWLPFFLVRLVMVVADVPEIIAFKEWWRICYNLSSFNCWFSSVLNPLLFSLMSSKFRKTLKTQTGLSIYRSQRPKCSASGSIRQLRNAVVVVVAKTSLMTSSFSITQRLMSRGGPSNHSTWVYDCRSGTRKIAVVNIVVVSR